MTQEQIIEEVEKMTVLELNTLVKAIEEKWGVSAAAVAVAGPAAAAAEEKSEFNVELTSFGEQKIAVIKIVKEVLALGLAEAKTMVESAPVMLKADVKKEDAEAWKTKIEAVGGKVTLK
jgi:large subunit ribosomal protein L7/L12